MAQESQSNQYSHIASFEEVNTIKFNEQIQSLEGSVIIELFEIDTAKYGGQVYRFHAGVNDTNADIIWQSNTYTKYPVKAEGFEFKPNNDILKNKPILEFKVDTQIETPDSIDIFHDRLDIDNLRPQETHVDSTGTAGHQDFDFNPDDLDLLKDLDLGF